jgi:hypothetical protein
VRRHRPNGRPAILRYEQPPGNRSRFRSFRRLSHPLDTFGSVIEEVLAVPDLIRSFLESEEADTFEGEGAARLVGIFAETERLAVAAKLRYARRVEKSNFHKADGHKKAGTFLSTVTGESVGQSAAKLALMRAIEAQPVIEQAFSKGDLSESRAKQLAAVGEVCPERVPELVQAATELDFAEFSRRCRLAKVAGESAEDSAARFERMRSKRYCRTWTDDEGFGRLDARMTPDALAVIRSGLEPFERQFFEKARSERRFEPRQAHAADLVAMAMAAISGEPAGAAIGTAVGAAGRGVGRQEGGGARTQKPVIRIRVDLESLRRGATGPGETCEVVGGGPIPVPVVACQIEEAILELVATKGTEVVSVCSDSRHISRVLRIALEERDPRCIVPGCNASDPLEIDHWRTDFAKGGKTTLDNLCRLCPHHHDLKTFKGWRVEGGPGFWKLTRPVELSGSSVRAGPANGPGL